MLRLPRHAGLRGLLLAALSTGPGCGHGRSDAVARATSAPASPARPTLDPTHLFEVLRELSADRMQGRGTLSPAIERAATYLAAALAHAGAAPVGGSYLHRFPVARKQATPAPASEAPTPVPVESAAMVPNVLGVIPGTDLAHEIVVLGAHYDHIGVAEDGTCPVLDGDGICNGADDNASGTALVVELARAFAAARERPRRTLAFVLFAGEELGLLGSRAFVRHLPDAPPFAQGEVVAMLNADMIGRLGPHGLAVGGVGSSPGWMPIFDAVGHGGVPTVYDRSITSRSDHASFYEEGVPVLFFFTGLHEDYHAPADHFERIDRAGLRSIGEVVLGVARALAQGAPVPFAVPEDPSEGLVGRLPGTDPATVERRVGFPPG